MKLLLAGDGSKFAKKTLAFLALMGSVVQRVVWACDVPVLRVK